MLIGARVDSNVSNSRLYYVSEVPALVQWIIPLNRENYEEVLGSNGSKDPILSMDDALCAMNKPSLRLPKNTLHCLFGHNALT